MKLVIDEKDPRQVLAAQAFMNVLAEGIATKPATAKAPKSEAVKIVKSEAVETVEPEAVEMVDPVEEGLAWIKEKVAELAPAGHKKVLKEKLVELGANKVVQLKTDKYPAFIAVIKTLL